MSGVEAQDPAEPTELTNASGGAETEEAEAGEGETGKGETGEAVRAEWEELPKEEPPKLVGIVLVSHSATVAESVAQLATRLAGGGRSAPIAPAGGTPDGGIGTSADLIVQAAHRVDRGAGVAVLADLGSSVLTVQALLAEEDELPEGTRLVDAPFVEGAVAAVVTASAGADLEAVAATAGEAYGYRKV